MTQRETTWWCDVYQSRIPLDGRSRPADDTTAPARSEAEVEALKSRWDRDPSWDLYCAKGFERHQSELFSHQMASDSVSGQTHDTRVEATANLLHTGQIPAAAVEAEARTLLATISHWADRFERPSPLYCS